MNDEVPVQAPLTSGGQIDHALPLTVESTDFNVLPAPPDNATNAASSRFGYK